MYLRGNIGTTSLFFEVFERERERMRHLCILHIYDIHFTYSKMSEMMRIK